MVLVTTLTHAGDTSMSVAQLNIDLARVNAQIICQKALEKLQNCKLSARTADKYTALQTAYMHACKKLDRLETAISIIEF